MSLALATGYWLLAFGKPGPADPSTNQIVKILNWTKVRETEN